MASLPAGLEHEIILVDDGSTDGTREWMAKLSGPPFVTLCNEARGGYAHANNRAARTAKGRFLALLNNDLIFTPGWLEPMLKPFARWQDVGIVGNIQRRAQSGVLDHAGITINLQGKPEHLDGSLRPAWRIRAYSRRQAITGACCLIERERFLALEGFDEGFVNGSEDIDLCFRLRDRRLKVLVANRSIVRHHVSASPGRKDHDEKNSRRLFARWRDRLVRDGARYWPLAYLKEHWFEPREFEHRLLRQALVRILGVRRDPAPHALSMLDRNIVLEETRWQEILGPLEGKQ